jgi:hypothetical protein
MPEKTDRTVAARSRRYRQRHPERRAASNRKASAKYARTEKGIRARARRIELAHRKPKQQPQNLHITDGRHIDRPRLLWLDQHGHLQIEEEISAEELIRRWQRKHTKEQA